MARCSNALGRKLLGPLSTAGLLALCLAPAAEAGNADKPRVPVEFENQACMVVVERNADPVFHIDYTIPEEDLDPLTDDEVADSRTHQFFAFSADFSFLPEWITEADVAAAAEQGLVAAENIGPSQILELDPEWANVDWVRITPDDARLPIDFATAELGVDWDTSALAAGTWIVAGYTWEPATNLWSKRSGVVRVVDDAADLEASGPSIALEPVADTELEGGETFTLEGCALGMAGTTLEVSWEVVGEPSSGVLYEGPLPEQDFALELEAPRIESSLELVRLRATLEDPEGRSYEARSPNEIQVSAAPASDTDSGGCRTGPRQAPPALVFALGALLLAFRRRRAAVYSGDGERRRGPHALRTGGALPGVQPRHRR